MRLCQEMDCMIVMIDILCQMPDGSGKSNKENGKARWYYFAHIYSASMFRSATQVARWLVGNVDASIPP